MNLTTEQEEQVIELSARGKTVVDIAYLIKSTRYQIDKYLLRTSTYILAREKRTYNYNPMDSISKQPFSTSEQDYGTKEVSYNLEDLCYTEKALFKTIDHKQLRRWKQ